MKENSYSMSSFFLKINEMLWKKASLQKLRVLFYFFDLFLLAMTKKPRVIDAKPRKKKILVIYNMALGDGIMFLSAASELRRIYPKDQFEITIACQSSFVQLYKMNVSFDVVLPLDFSSSVVNLKNRLTLFRELRKVYYDIILDPVGCESCTTNVFVTRAAVGAKKIGMFDKNLPYSQCPQWIRKKVYSRIITTDKPALHLLEYYGEFLHGLGLNDFIAKPAELPKHHLEVELPENYFIMFPTASMPVKRWPLERFAEISERIYKATGYPLVVCGTSHDRPVIEEFLSKVHDVQVIDIIGKTGILQFIEVIRGASLIVTNDTSAYHIAVATKSPVALICGGYTYTRYANYKYKDALFTGPNLITNYMPCFDCNNNCKYRNISIFPCIDSITTDRAWNFIGNMIDEEGKNNGF